MDPEEVEVKNADRRKWVIGAALARAILFRLGLHPNCYNTLTDKVSIVAF